jgi:hypothetical protein
MLAASQRGHRLRANFPQWRRTGRSQLAVVNGARRARGRGLAGLAMKVPADRAARNKDSPAAIEGRRARGTSAAR